MVAIKKHSSKLKDWSFEMPKASNTKPLCDITKRQLIKYDRPYR